MSDKCKDVGGWWCSWHGFNAIFTQDFKLFLSLRWWVGWWRGFIKENSIMWLCRPAGGVNSFPHHFFLWNALEFGDYLHGQKKRPDCITKQLIRLNYKPVAFYEKFVSVTISVQYRWFQMPGAKWNFRLFWIITIILNCVEIVRIIIVFIDGKSPMWTEKNE